MPGACFLPFALDLVRPVRDIGEMLYAKLMLKSLPNFWFKPLLCNLSDGTVPLRTPCQGNYREKGCQHAG
jgi:hypothetical protein